MTMIGFFSDKHGDLTIWVNYRLNKFFFGTGGIHKLLPKKRKTGRKKQSYLQNIERRANPASPITISEIIPRLNPPKNRSINVLCNSLSGHLLLIKC